MENVYDLHHYNQCLAIYIGSTKISIESFSTARRNSAKFYNSLTRDTFIKYDEQKKNILGWGNRGVKSGNDNGVKIDKFIERLYQLFEKGKDNWNKDDLFSLKAISDFMRLSVEELIKESKQEIKDTGALHYMFIIPSEWEEEVREIIIRPIFTQANLISNEDHSDRLLFCSDLESFYYDKSEIFKVAKDTLFCRLTPIDKEQVLIKLDLVSCVNTLFDFSGSMLFPKVVNSNSSILSIKHIKNSIRAVLKAHLSLCIQGKHLQNIIEAAFGGVPSNLDENEDDVTVLMAPLITDTSKWGLDSRQEAIIKSICPYDICAEIVKALSNSVVNLISNNRMKEYHIMTLVDEYSSEIILDHNLVNWSKSMLEYNRTTSDLKITRYEYNIAITFSFDFLHHGSIVYIREAIQNSDLYSKPRIISSNKMYSRSSIFIKSKPDAIMNIDISQESTLLSLSLLDDDGLISKIWDHKYFIKDTNLRSLGSFFNFSKVQTLKIDYSFITFAQKYFRGGSNILSDNKDSVLKDIMAEIEAIMNTDNHSKDLLVSTQQSVYIKAFIFIYMIYLKDIVSSKLLNVTGHNVDMKIGYSITIENMLLINLFGTKEDFEDVIYASGLLRKDDDCKKLRVITQGEGILPAIQQCWKLQFPVKSFFVVAHLHEYYIRLTLNQVVTEEGEQEAFIIRDEIIHIPNVYASLCLNMWNNIVEENSLIQLCDKHLNNELLEIFSVQNQICFTRNLTRYLSNNILKTNSILQVNTKTAINISTSCSCRVCLVIDDLVEICFRPVIQNLISLVSSSLVNRELFGRYRHIQYIFYLICFNYNPHFQPILIKILQDETDQFMYEQGMDLPHYIIPKLSNQLLQPVLRQRPLSYKGFLVGFLQHICSENYGFGFYFPNECKGFSYKNSRSDTKSILIDRETVFPIFKKGDKVTSNQIDRVFYVSSQTTNANETPFWIHYYTLKNTDSLKMDETVPLKDISERITTSYLDTNGIKKAQYLPIVISIVYNGHSSSFSLIVKIVGGELKSDSSVTVGEPMTLIRI